MSYIWEIPGWNSGAKVRRRGWCSDECITRDADGTWCNQTSFILSVVAHSVMYHNDWELYEDKPVEVEVFEWMTLLADDFWYISPYPKTEEQARKYYEGEEYRKTGRSWKVPVRK